MIVVRIEHQVTTYDGWKKGFDSDPIDRRQSGVVRYHIYQPVDDQKYVIIDLEFDELSKAQTCYSALQNMMSKVVGTLVIGPSIRILNVIESKQY